MQWFILLMIDIMVMVSYLLGVAVPFMSVIFYVILDRKLGLNT